MNANGENKILLSKVDHLKTVIALCLQKHFGNTPVPKVNPVSSPSAEDSGDTGWAKSGMAE